tara:strand:+ start:247 stop:573 length:327 start_codon:yes stop_codon:yes gene_type:complete
MNFESQEGRSSYLNEKLDNLLTGINASYGQALLDELVTRLMRTINDFNQEVEDIMGDLKESSDRRSQIIHDLMEGNEITDSNDDSSDKNSGDENSGEMSAWEKKLEGL